MTKNISIVIQSRLGSQRVPGKMLKPFAGTTLVDILLSKVVRLKNITPNQIFFCAYERKIQKYFLSGIIKYQLTT